MVAVQARAARSGEARAVTSSGRPLRAPSRPRNRMRTGPARGATACGQAGTPFRTTRTRAAGTPSSWTSLSRQCVPITSMLPAPAMPARRTARAGLGRPAWKSKKSAPCRCSMAGSPMARASRHSVALRHALPRVVMCMWAQAARPLARPQANVARPRAKWAAAEAGAARAPRIDDAHGQTFRVARPLVHQVAQAGVPTPPATWLVPPPANTRTCLPLWTRTDTFRYRCELPL